MARRARTAKDFVGLAETILNALDASGIGMSITAQIDGRFERLYFNSAGARILGYPEDELAAMPPMLPIAEDRRSEVAELYKRWLAGDPIPHMVETELVRKDGTRVPVEVGLSWADYDGNPATVAFIRDVSDRRRAETEHARMEAELLQAERMATVGTLAAGVAHEINNPLTYMLLNMERLRGELGEPGERQDLLKLVDSALDGGERVKVIVRDLLAFARPHRSEVGPVDVGKTMRSALQLADNALRHRARVDAEIDEVPPAKAIGARLGQVFLNVLVNAAQAFENDDIDRNVVRVRVRSPSPDEVVVEVCDNGPGIPEEHLEEAFEPFFSTKPVGEGTGLGLAITRAIVSSFGGRVSLESTVGEGVRVTVSLPTAPAESARTVPPGPPAPEPRTDERPRVLVVDDEELVGRAVCGMLRSRFDTEQVTSGRSALERLGAEPPIQLVLCDLVMPGMTGMDLYARVAEEMPGMAKRFLFFTGGAFTRNATEFVEKTDRTVLRKPVDKRELVAALLSVLAETR